LVLGGPGVLFFLPDARIPAWSALALRDALPIYARGDRRLRGRDLALRQPRARRALRGPHRGREHRELGLAVDLRGRGGHRLLARSEEHTSELQSREKLVCRLRLENNTGRLRARE